MRRSENLEGHLASQQLQVVVGDEQTRAHKGGGVFVIIPEHVVAARGDVGAFEEVVAHESAQLEFVEVEGFNRETQLPLQHEVIDAETAGVFDQTALDGEVPKVLGEDRRQLQLVAVGGG